MYITLYVCGVCQGYSTLILQDKQRFSAERITQVRFTIPNKKQIQFLLNSYSIQQKILLSCFHVFSTIPVSPYLKCFGTEQVQMSYIIIITRGRAWEQRYTIFIKIVFSLSMGMCAFLTVGYLSMTKTL